MHNVKFSFFETIGTLIFIRGHIYWHTSGISQILSLIFRTIHLFQSYPHAIKHEKDLGWGIKLLIIRHQMPEPKFEPHTQ